VSEMLSIILPAHDEAEYIGGCLSALLASEPLADNWWGEIIVVANGCRDDTADLARGYVDAALARGWALRVIEVAQGGKLNALNLGDEAAQGGTRIYLDADVIVDPGLIDALVEVLEGDTPRYSSGQARLAPAQSRVTTAYGRFWSRLPFVTQGVPGFGVFAMNAEGRARWGPWPDIISDDTFARLNFAPRERVGVSPGYVWPMVEGFANLVRVRRRQNAGVTEIGGRYPGLLANDAKQRLGMGGLVSRALRDPVGFCVYAAVAIAVKTPLFGAESHWARGR